MAEGRIEVNEELCKGCDFCARVCPFHLISRGQRFNAKGYRPAVLTDPEQRCTGCMLCAMICPEAAITVYRQVKQRAG